MVSSIILGFLKLGEQGLNLANTKAIRKYADELHDIELDILNKKSHGQESDDRLIEYLEKRYDIALAALERELSLLVNKK